MDVVAALHRFVRLFDRLQIHYAIMGGWAVRVYALPRPTFDVDFTIPAGTTTAVVLGQAMVAEGLRVVTAGANPMVVKRGIEKAVEAVVAEIRASARPVETREQIAAVAAISAADPEVGEIIWGGLAFLIVAFGLIKFGFPALRKGLADREAKIREDLELRTGRPVAAVTGVHRPVPLHFAWSMRPIHEAIHEVVRTAGAPVYVVHFTQAAAADQAQALMSQDWCSKEEKRALTLVQQEFWRQLDLGLGYFLF